MAGREQPVTGGAGRALALTGSDVNALRALLARADPARGDDAQQAAWELVGYLGSVLDRAEAGGWVSGAGR